jgi:proteasome lid subunit RPN8/RPN11
MIKDKIALNAVESLALNVIEAIKAHAEKEQPRECCGLLVEMSDGWDYWPCRNLSPLPNQFHLHPEDWAEAEDAGDIKAVVHSHINQSAAPSQADLAGCEASGLPWVILALPSGEIRTLAPTGWLMPLVGREFVWGISDCYTLVRDYYRETLGIVFATPEPYEYEFWKRGQDLYARYAQWGFVLVPDDQPPQLHDVFLIQIKSDVANHAAIYLGDDKILHHVQGRLSERTVYGGFWAKATLKTIRHQSLC